MLNFLMLYYLLVFIFVGIGCTLAITSDYDEIVSRSGKVNFLKLIFMYQYAVYQLTKDNINTVGIILLEILTTLSVWFLNILVLIVICVCYIGLFICRAFYFVFRKRR